MAAKRVTCTGFTKVFKVSRRFRVCLREDDYGKEYVCCSGSACDIQKVVRDLEADGYYNYYDKPTLFSARDDYRVTFPREKFGFTHYSVRKIKRRK